MAVLLTKQYYTHNCLYVVRVLRYLTYRVTYGDSCGDYKALLTIMQWMTQSEREQMANQLLKCPDCGEIYAERSAYEIHRGHKYTTCGE